jgi:hypothetical protein
MKCFTFVTHIASAFKTSRTNQIFLTGLALVFICLPSLEAAGPAAVDLGSCAHFTILSGAAITTTGGGIVNGDVGASPITGSAVGLTAAQVNGTIYVVDAGGPPGSVIAPALLTAAKGDLTTAYNDAAGRPAATAPPFLNPGGGNIGGMNLAAGIYTFSSTASISGSDVTLTGGANDVWIFQIPSDLNVGSGIHVILAGGAQARNIFWQVGDIATIGTTAVFNGTILADQSITMNTSSTMDGRLLAFSAGVTFNANGGNIPMPAAPNFTNVFVTATNSVTLVLNTTPYFLATLQASTNLSAPNWMLVATNNPVTNLWTFTEPT